MPRAKIDLAEKIRQILQHTSELPLEADAPLSHFRRTSADVWNLLCYVERKFEQAEVYQKSADQHLTRLNRMLLADLIENFERFLKELAAVCVDCLAPLVFDDRFNVFRIQGATIAAHFSTDTLGRSLCESATWLDCKEINSRFRALLAEPHKDGKFTLFPNNSKQDEAKVRTLSLIWQLRHTIVHNVGVITQSDAAKLSHLAQASIGSPRIVSPDRNDIRYLNRFLDEVANSCIQSVGKQLERLLSLIDKEFAPLRDAQTIADRLSAQFGMVITVVNCTGKML